MARNSLRIGIPPASTAASSAPAEVPTYTSNALTENARPSGPRGSPTKKSSRAASAPSSYMPPVIPPPHRQSAVRTGLPGPRALILSIVHRLGEFCSAAEGVQRAGDLVHAGRLEQRGQAQGRALELEHRAGERERALDQRRVRADLGPDQGHLAALAHLRAGLGEAPLDARPVGHVVARQAQ